MVAERRETDDGQISAFADMRAIENTLRELIIERLNATAGSRWYKARVPADVRAKFNTGIEIEKRFPWLQLVPYHPIYYVDFPDLKKLIERQDNWDEAFRPIFGNRKEIISSLLSELEPLRNAIAHNRTLSQSSVALVRDARERLRAALGSDWMDALLQHSTEAPDVPKLLRELREEGEQAGSAMNNSSRFVPRDRWDDVKDQWWFDDDYLNTNIASIKSFHFLVDEYAAIPRIRGDGYKIERWLAERRYDDLLAAYRESWKFLREGGG